MIEIGKAIVSLDVFTRHFLCDLAACKGICCEEGDAGAPLSKDELPILEAIYPAVAPYLRPEGRAAIEAQGFYVIDTDGEEVTPLINNKECAYTIYESGVAKCGIEKAWAEKKIDWQKPLSCHLYPIRITQYREFDAVNYDKQLFCAPARKCGAKHELAVFKFLKEPLIRKYGQEWYALMEEADKLIPESRKK
jgi:hypothetical protein